MDVEQENAPRTYSAVNFQLQESHASPHLLPEATGNLGNGVNVYLNRAQFMANDDGWRVRF
jgi:hypothetical protein